MDHIGRRTLPHHVPSWVDPAASDYFITIGCQERGINQLCNPEVGDALLEVARFYYTQGKWFPALLLLMPDHLHMLVSFGREHEMTKVVTAWKRYTAAKFGLNWQRGFFEHRLRAAESVEEKAAYILRNPVRARLVQKAEDWPWVLILDPSGGEVRQRK